MIEILLQCWVYLCPLSRAPHPSIKLLGKLNYSSEVVQWYKWEQRKIANPEVYVRASQVALVVKNQLANARRHNEIQVWSLNREDPPGGGHDNPLQYSCLENPMDRGALWATVHRVIKSQTQLKWLSIHIGMHEVLCHPGNDGRLLW